MKKLFAALFGWTMLAACADSVDLSSIPDSRALNNQNVQALSATVGPVDSYQWTKLSTPQPQVSFSLAGPSAYVIGETAFVKTGEGGSRLFKLSNTKTWEYIASGPLKEAFDDFSGYLNWKNYCFAYGSKFYYYVDGTFNSVNVNNGAHETLAPFPASWRDGKMSFVIGTKGYVMGGMRYRSGYGFENVNDLWEYNFTMDQWTFKGTVPGGSRSYGVTAVIDQKLYVGLGTVCKNFSTQHKRDWLRVDFSVPGAPQVLSDFPEDVLGNDTYSVDDDRRPFVINNKVYVHKPIYWDSQVGHKNFLCEYNPATDRWSWRDTPMQDGVYYTLFSIGNAGYMIKGPLAELWRYSNTSLVPVNP
ncbi:MAG TPA: hypothetical protein VK666_03860 [Chryseolinea sp.]|nr:hypothetical protein [Chryseolinea sp.]